MRAVRGFPMPSDDPAVQRALRGLIRKARVCGALGISCADDNGRAAYERSCWGVAHAAAIFAVRERDAKAKKPFGKPVKKKAAPRG